MKKIVRTYDTITGKYVDVQVNEDVYNAFMRTGWKIENNDNAFYNHEIQFSALIGGHENAYENFHEFISESNSVETTVYSMIYTEKMRKAMNELSKSDRHLICLLFFEGLSERDCAARYGINQKNIHKKKERILFKLNKLLLNS